MPTVWDENETPPALPLRLRLAEHSDKTVRLEAARPGERSKAFALAWLMEPGLFRQRLTTDISGRLGMPLDANGCIALHPDDAAMVRIRELEARVAELEEKHEDALRRERAANEQLHLERCRVEGMAEVNANMELALLKPTPTVAPELTDEQCKTLWVLFRNSDSENYADIRAMIAAYEAMRRPVTDAYVEKLARRMRAEWSGDDAVWAELTYEAREPWRRSARVALEYRG